MQSTSAVVGEKGIHLGGFPSFVQGSSSDPAPTGCGAFARGGHDRDRRVSSRLSDACSSRCSASDPVSRRCLDRGARSSSQSISSSAKARVSFPLGARGRCRKARRSRRPPTSSLVRATRRGILGNGGATRRKILGNGVAIPPLVVPVVGMLDRPVIPTVSHAGWPRGIARWMVVTTMIPGLTAVRPPSISGVALVPRGVIGR